MTLDPAYTPLFAFLTVAGAVLAAGPVLRCSPSRLRHRLRSFEAGFPTSRGEAKSLWERWKRHFSFGRTVSADSSPSQSLQQRLSIAGFDSASSAGVYRAARLALSMLPLALGAIIYLVLDTHPRWTLLVSLTASLIGFLTPGLFVARRGLQRQIVLRRSLPDFLDLMTTCVESGLSLHAAIDRVTDELAPAHPVLCFEMQRLQREITLGGTAEVALRRLADRSGLEAISGLATAVQQSLQFGAGIVDALRTHADTLRQEREQAAEERAQRASIKILLPTLLFIFPVTFVVLAGPALLELEASFASPHSHGVEPRSDAMP